MRLMSLMAETLNAAKATQLAHEALTAETVAQ